MARRTVTLDQHGSDAQNRPFPTKSVEQIGHARRAMWVPLVIALLGTSLQGAPGDLDPTFGAGGKVLTDFGPGINSARAVAIQADGRIIAAGGAGGIESVSADFAFARYKRDGTLDTSFGSGGKVVISINEFDVASAVGIQSDGKIVAAGATGGEDTGFPFALLRLHVDGALDTSFDGDGKVTTGFGVFAWAFAMAIQPDGRIVAAGFVDGDDDPQGVDFALARYNADGSLDQSFGVGGKVITDFGGFLDQAHGVVVQADGKIVAAGRGGPLGGDFVLARYNANGSLDASFGSAGRVITDLGGLDSVNAMVLQPDGRIVVAGHGTFLSRSVLARYDTDGDLDASFGVGGIATHEFFGENFRSAVALALQTNGKIVAAGSATAPFNSSFALARYHTDGRLDRTFGIDGLVTTDFGDPDDVGVLCPPTARDCSNDSAHGVAIQRDGKTVAVGRGAGPCRQPVEGEVPPPCSFALARYDGDAAALGVTIDVKPGSNTNPINLSSSGVVPVVILSTATFDARTVRPSSACFGDEDHADERDCSEAHGRGHVEDVNRDGRPDQVLHFNTNQTGIDSGDTRACLTGTTFDGLAVQGCDTVRTRK